MAKSKDDKWYKTSKNKKSPLKIILIILAAVAAIAVVSYFLFPSFIQQIINKPVEPFDMQDEETVKMYAPVDDGLAARVDALPQGSGDETWAFYVYLVGSNLESCGIDELSEYTKYMVYDDYQRNTSETKDSVLSAVRTFSDEVTGQGMDLPKVLYNPIDSSKYTDSSSAIYRDPDSVGAATSDLSEMVSGIESDKIKVVVQTGGSKRWQNAQINPNRSQRFVISADGMEKVYDKPIVNMATPESFADFLTFCNRNYNADHKIVVLWDHGGGIGGYGKDEIYNHIMSLSEIQQGFNLAVANNMNDPYYDAIVFDACLMGMCEVGNYLAGYADYLFASEEFEPSSGLFYEEFLSKLADNLSFNVAQLGKEIADSYVLGSLEKNSEYGILSSVTFSVIDLSKIPDLWNAYAKFCDSALNAVSQNTSELAKLSKAAQSAVSFGMDYASYFNGIDLGTFMEEASGFLPEESAEVLRLLDETVVYHRNSSPLKDASGIAVYFPARLQDVSDLDMFLTYESSICDDIKINALYYYKLAGCLNEKLSDCGYELKNINYSEVLDKLGSENVTCTGDGNLTMKLSEEETQLLQNVRFGLVGYDPDTDDVIYYGEDTYAFLNDNGEVSTDFKGKWISFDGNLLPISVQSATGDSEIFSTDIEYNGYEASLITSYDAELGEVSILGVSLKDNELNAARSLLPLKEGDLINILYEVGNLYSNISDIDDELVIYHAGRTKIEEVDLPSGEYYEYLVFEDLRSDTYDSKVVHFTVSRGSITEQTVDESIISYDKS